MVVPASFRGLSLLWRECCVTTDTRRRRLASGMIRPPIRPPRSVRSIAGRSGHGFDYFYGFLVGETSQWEPRLVESTNRIEPLHNEKYHLTGDLVRHGIDRLRHHQAFAPDKPFFLYWAPGAGHVRHQIFKEWADKYKGQFDDGWDAYGERSSRARGRCAGSRPTPSSRRALTRCRLGQHSRSTASIPVPADGSLCRFVEHADVQAGRVVDEFDRLGIRDNTIVAGFSQGQVAALSDHRGLLRGQRSCGPGSQTSGQPATGV